MDFQCTHELINNDGEFILEKRGTGYWCNKIYCKAFGDHGYHITRATSDDVQESNSGESDVIHRDPIIADLMEGSTTDEKNGEYKEGTPEDKNDEFEEGTSEDNGRMTKTSTNHVEKK